jgi:hypothetical protein
MADGPKINNPVVRVVMDDGAEWEVQTLNPDLLRYEDTAARHKWGSPQDSPMLWSTFIAWAASKREGLTALKWEEFKDAAISISVQELTEMDPTNPAAEGD